MESSDHTPTLSLAAQPACESCRIRKCRCDRKSPCSQCRAANLPCRTENQRHKVHKQRVQVSKQYENKIDSIDHRLANIEKLLQQAHSSRSSPATKSSSEYAPAEEPDDTVAASLSISEDNARNEKPAPGYNGASFEITAATRVLEQTIDRDPALQHNSELVAAVGSLRSVLNSGHLSPSSPDNRLNGADLIRPGWEQVQDVLKRVEGTKPMLFHMLPPVVYDDFCRKTRSLYEEGHNESPTGKLLVYAGLSSVCQEYTAESDGLSASYNHQLQRAFSWLLMKALATLPLLVPASIESLESLLLAALTMIGMCKPSLAWSLISKASNLCQKLGHNRLGSSVTSPDPQFDRKVMLFWAVYTIDRNIAFRLGHAPAIQDYDIDTPMFIENDQRHSTMIELMTFWRDAARVQGKICTQLYGPAASVIGTDDRARIAEGLASELQQIYLRKHQANSVAMSASGRTPDGMYVSPWTYGDEVMHYSTLTTALYAIPSSHPGHARALEAARQCLRISRDLSNRYLHNVYNWTVCCHWVLLHAPITTLTSIFYNIIANPCSSEEDIKLLEDFVASIEPARRLSDPIAKFHQLCSAFVKVAQAYVKAKIAQNTIINSSVASSNLRTLRPAAASYAPNHGATEQRELEQWPQQQQRQQDFLDASESFQDWYMGNASLYGLLEQDFDDTGFDLFNDSIMHG